MKHLKSLNKKAQRLDAAEGKPEAIEEVVAMHAGKRAQTNTARPAESESGWPSATDARR